VSTGQERKAKNIAEKKDYDAIPIIDHGSIRRYWSKEQLDSVRITRYHRISHDRPIAITLPRLKAHGVQFVYYRTEVVGLIDVSDLNKPLARIVWLHPIVECEQRIIERAVKSGIEDAQIENALPGHARTARKHQRKALEQNLKLPLLSFLHFREVLRAGVEFGIITLSRDEIVKLNDLRNRTAHSGRSLIENKGHCDDLIWAKTVTERLLRQLR